MQTANCDMSGEDRDEGRRRLPRLRTLILGTVALVLIGFAVALVVAIRAAREAAIVSCAQCPLNQMHLALCNYHSTYRCFPPAYVADASGNRMHSWRALILPFVEEQGLYAAYRFDEPWNGPNNSKLANRMPRIFHVCSEPESTSFTNLVVITGPGTAFPGSASTRMEDFADGLDNTILLAEIARSDINWLEPRDLDVETMSFVPNDPSKPSISTSRRNGPYVVFADRISGHLLSPTLRPETLRALTTISGGEKMYVVELRGLGLSSPAAGPATDDLLKALGNLDTLHALWLSRSDVTDRGLAHIATSRGLDKLSLRSTRITDKGLTYLQGLTSLCELDISYTRITDQGLRQLAGLSQLRWLKAKGTQVTEAGVKELRESLPQCSVAR